MIEQVIKFSADLQLHTFARKRNVLEHSRVLIISSWLAEKIAGESPLERPIYGYFASERYCIGDTAAVRIIDWVESIMLSG